MQDLPLDIAQLPAGDLAISETFLSFQGEGKLAGVPSYFVRLSGCNLRCAWCDTPYASWSPEFTRTSIDDLVREASRHAARHAVITGGEPFLAPSLATLCTRLRDARFHITIETAGTIWREVACDLISISPKLANSTPRNDPRDPSRVWEARHEERRLRPDVITRLIAAYADRQLKFVVSSEADLPEIERLLAGLSGFEPSDVLLMPEGVTPPSAATRRWIVDACIARGWRYCPRLHLEVFGNTRGT